MPRPNLAGRVAVAASAVGLLLLAGCAATAVPQAEGAGAVLPDAHAHSSTQAERAAQSPPQSVPLRTANPRRSNGVVASGGSRAPYNYAPTVLDIGGSYRMWWCSQLPGSARPGDQILYATSASPNGPFAGPDGAPGERVFNNSAGGFDSLHTCDPSVIQVGGTYYLYYTGTPDPGGNHNSIGLATSRDGVHWTRANNGVAILAASGETTRANAYGAGQPSALYLDGWFYLMFTDTTGKAAAPDGAGQFVLRSPDPAFGRGVQALGPAGFTPVARATGARTRSVADATTSDWMWVDALQAFAIASDGQQGTVVTFWNAGFTYQPYQPVVIGGPQREGPGLVRTPDGHAPVSTTDPCGQVPLDVLRATGGNNGPSGLAHFGLDLTGVPGCQRAGTAASLLAGFAVPAPDRTVDIVVGGHLVEVERRSVALALAKGMVTDPPAAIAALPVAAHLKAGVAAITAPGRPVAVAADGKLWVLGSTTVAALNSSAVATVSDQRWDAYPRGADLSDLRP
jgi:hypothetical protein